MVRSSDLVRRPRRSAEEATSVSEGPTCLLLVMPVTSATGALLLPSVKELEGPTLEASPRGRFLLLRPSLSFPLPRFPRLPATFRRDVPLPLPAPGPWRDLPLWPTVSPLTLGRRWCRSPVRRWELSRAAEPSPTLGCRWWTPLSKGGRRWRGPARSPHPRLGAGHGRNAG